MITNLSLYCWYTFSNASYWGVYPHLEAVFTTSIFLPLNLEKSIVPPSMDFTLKRWIVRGPGMVNALSKLTMAMVKRYYMECIFSK